MRPDRGLVHIGIEVLNQRGEPVLTMTAVNFRLRRTAAGRAAAAGYSDPAEKGVGTCTLLSTGSPTCPGPWSTS